MTNPPGYDQYIKGADFIESGEFNRALTYLKKAHSLDPNQPGILHNLGFVYEKLGQIDKAINYYHQVTKKFPQILDSHHNLANLYYSLGDHKKSLKHYQSALDIDPNHHQALLGKCVVLSSTNPKKALPIVKSLLKTHPSITAYTIIATYHQQYGSLKSAAKYFLEGHKKFPQEPGLLSNLVYTYRLLCNWVKTDKYQSKLDTLTKSNKNISISPFISLINSTNLSKNQKNAKNFYQNNFSHIKPLPLSTKNIKSGKIIIGYLSSDYKKHVIARHILSVFRHHNRKLFSPIAYSTGENDYSLYRKKFESIADKFVDVSSLSFTDVAQKIKKDNIDILVDLTGYTTNSKFEILCFRPAPIQISYLGFPGTSGADCIDYIIADKYLIPRKYKKYYSEKVLHLPSGYQVSSYDEFDIPKTPTKASQNLPDDKFIFCSFNNSYKIDQKTFTTWLKILKNTPNSVLWLAPYTAPTRKNFTNATKQFGISPNRIIFAPPMSFPEHLSRIPLADIALDTPRYNGGSTTSNALYMGVPVITIEGSHYPSRMSTSFLSFLNQSSLITKNLKDYQNLSTHLATHPKKLENIKVSLKNKVKTAPMFNPKKMTSALEKVYLNILNSKS